MDSLNVFGCTSPVNTVLKSRPEAIPGLSSLTLPELSTKDMHCRNLYSPGPATVMSPVTNLALDMNSFGLGSQFDTPKRRKHPPLEKISSFASDVSSDAGLGMDPPSPMDAVEMEDTFEKAIQQSSRVVNERMPIRRNNSLPLQLQGFSPSLKGQETLDSHRYGIFGQQPSQIQMTASLTSQRDNKENMPEEGFEFKKPTKPVSRCRVRSSSDALSRRPSSAPALMFSSPTPIQQLDFQDSSPMFLRRSSPTSSLNDDEDDGFLDVMDDHMENDSGMPMGMASLLTAPLVADNTGEDSPVIRCRPRSLFRSPSMPSPVSSRSSMKRPDCPGDENTPIRVKRRRSLAGIQVTPMEQNPESPRTGCSLLQRSKSFCQTDIEKLLDGQVGPNELIGDFTKPFVLPTVEGKHQDLKYITPDTMVASLSGKFNHLVEQVIIMDCRYPYEFEGGHIKGALNLHQGGQCRWRLPPHTTPCLLSAAAIFPREGGYKDFFPHFQAQCEPQSYRPMHHEDFKEDLRKFRLKSRTWAGERSKRDMYSRLKKL
ncbi:hypothetical protein PFLUV_G00229150 [Perca fluviatilis]|uniref:protein-tyrosine-phosphatase n=1 Tax=Perca fluviatilis TaxID=8168 RepID=A0A6A5EEG4_PERFL|nr:hypothetical protein PFLUV_G00229150 [Perca fluviatilis]